MRRPWLLISVLAGCSSALSTDGLRPPEPPAFCEIATRLAEAGFLNRAEMVNEDYHAAPEWLAAAAGIDMLIVVPPPGDHPLARRLMIRPVRLSSLAACARRNTQRTHTPEGDTRPDQGAPPATSAPGPATTSPVPAPAPQARRQPPEQKAQTLRRVRTPPPRKVEPGQDAYMVEQVSCEGASGAWILLYEGEVVAREAQQVWLRAQRRYGVRYWPGEEGADATDWYCVPRRRFCWSQVGFGDWRGKARSGDLLEAAAEDLFPERLRLSVGLAPIIRARCGF